jgi:hypothetical protein
MTDIFQDALAGDEAQQGQVPLDLDQATQWVAQVKGIRDRITEYQAAHAAAVKRLNLKLNEVVTNLETQEEWMLDALEMYHRTVLANDKERVTIQTPAGVLKSNAGQNKWVYEDNAAFEAWAMENIPAAVTPHPDTINKTKAKSALKDATISDGVVMTKDGVKVPGIRVAPPERTFKVITGEDDGPDEDGSPDE